MTAQQALDLLSSIPADNFIEKTYANPVTKCCCTTGHLTRIRSKFPDNYSPQSCSYVLMNDTEVDILVDTTREFLGNYEGIKGSIISINDCCIGKYQEDNPKDRVIHLLTDMVAAGY